MISVTDRGRERPGAVAGAAGALLLALGLGDSAVAATTPADLRAILEKTDKTLSQAERAVDGKDPGRVSLILARVDELLASFQDSSGLESLVKSFDEGRAAAGASNLAAASAAVRRASSLMSAVTDFVVLRQAAETSRAALRAAETHDSPAFLSALEGFDSAILAPVLLARVQEARAAVARARQAMVRNNMPDGKARLAEARRALNGLTFAGALSRASYSLAIGSEMLEGRSIISARDQMQKGMRDLRLAAETGPEGSRPVLEEIRRKTYEIWKRSGRAAAEDPAGLMELARQIDALRLQQPR